MSEQVDQATEAMSMFKVLSHTLSTPCGRFVLGKYSQYLLTLTDDEKRQMWDEILNAIDS